MASLRPSQGSLPPLYLTYTPSLPRLYPVSTPPLPRPSQQTPPSCAAIDLKALRVEPEPGAAGPLIFQAKCLAVLCVSGVGTRAEELGGGGGHSALAPLGPSGNRASGAGHQSVT